MGCCGKRSFAASGSVAARKGIKIGADASWLFAPSRQATRPCSPRRYRDVINIGVDGYMVDADGNGHQLRIGSQPL